MAYHEDSGVGASIMSDGGPATDWRPNFQGLGLFAVAKPADRQRGKPVLPKLILSPEEIKQSLPPNSYYCVERVETNNGIVFFTILSQYKDLEFLASGGQGVTAKATNELTKQTVVIKKVDIAFKDLDNLHEEECEEAKARALKATMREVKFLQLLKHPKILNLVDVFTTSETLDNFNELYHITMYRGVNLQDVRRKYTEDGSRMTHHQISKIVYQILEGVYFLHQLKIAHRDLKPSNIAIDEKMNVTLLDYGWSRRVDTSARLTQRVGTRLYNAPELLYQMKENYDNRVDIWAVGCIMGELVRLNYTFQGRTIDDLFSNITKILGSPSDSGFYKRFIPEDREKLEPKKGRKPNVKWDQHFPDDFFADGDGKASLTAKNARSLLSEMLTIDFTKRAKVETCLKHPYISYWGKPAKNETALDLGSIIDELEYENATNGKKTAAQWKDELFNFAGPLRTDETME